MTYFLLPRVISLFIKTKVFPEALQDAPVQPLPESVINTLPSSLTVALPMGTYWPRSWSHWTMGRLSPGGWLLALGRVTLLVLTNLLLFL